MPRQLDANEPELIERDALADLYAAAPRSLAVSGAGSEVVGTATIHTFPGGSPTLFNRVIGLGVGGPVGPRELDLVIASADARAREWVICLAPQAQPSSLYEQLVSRGFEPGYRWMKFRRDVATPVPDVKTDLVIRDAARCEGGLVAALLRRVYGFPQTLDAYVAALVDRAGWRIVVATEGETIVAAAAVFVRGAVAWFGLAGSLESHRRRGSHGALLAARIRTAAEMGARTLVVETGERVAAKPGASYRNILRFGFEEAYLRSNLLSPELARRELARRGAGLG